MSKDEQKRAAAQAAVAYTPADSVVGVGTGSTANFFIDELMKIKGRIRGAVASSEATAARLKQIGIPVLDLNGVDELPVYIDGADEVTRHLTMIKGGGGAATREKITAAVARKFICIADASKLVDVLGSFPVAVEVIAMARSFVARELIRLGGQPGLRQGFTSDNGHPVLDVHGFDMKNPVELENRINQIAGVVENGIFARRGADVLLLATSKGVETIKRQAI